MTIPDLPWLWLLPEDDERFPELPAATPTPTVSSDWIGRQLTMAFSQQSSTIVLLGWSPEALPWLAAEPTVRNRSVVWLVEHGHLREMQEQAEGIRAAVPGLLVAPYESLDDLPRIINRLPYIVWSPAALTGRPEDVVRLANHRKWRLGTWYFPPERILSDTVHFLAREADIGEAISLRSWGEAWKGRSALCVAAGPSLNQHMDFLRKHMDSCVVVAADVVSRCLEDAGIKIDFIMNADPHEAAISRIPTPRDPATVLVCPFESHRDLDKRCPRRSFEGCGPIGGFYLGEQHAYNHGTNVGSCTVGLAEFLGCSELILVGHDLAYSKTAYYSDMVHDRAAVEALSRADAAAKKTIRVLGNNGEMVETTPAFEHGIIDLAAMGSRIRQAGNHVYNLNMATGTGARIPNTEPLPEGWKPAGEGPCPRPGAGRRLADEWKDAPPPDFRSEVVRQMDRYSERIRQLPADTEGFLTGIDGCFTDRSLHLAHSMLSGFYIGHLILLYRHMLVGGASSTTRVAAKLRSQMDTCIEAGRRVVAGVLASGEVPPSSGADTPWALAAEALGKKVPRLAPGSVDEALFPNLLRDGLAARRLTEEVPLPEPSSVWDGIQYVAAYARWCPEWYFQRLLCLVQLEPNPDVKYVIEHARSFGVTIPDLDATDAHGDDPALRSSRALQRIRNGRSTDLLADARLAAAWEPFNQPCVEALLDLPDGKGEAALAAVVKEGLIAIDDPVAGLIIENCQDLGLALNLVWPQRDRLGERTALAVARRQLELRQPQQAYEEASRIGALSACAEDALVVRARAAFLHDGIDEAITLVNVIPGHELRVGVLYRFLVAEYGLMSAIDQLVRLGIEPVPLSVLAQAFSATRGEVPPQMLPAVLKSLLHLARRSLALSDSDLDREMLTDLVALGERAVTLAPG